MANYNSLDLTGVTVGRLRVVRKLAKRLNGYVVWQCVCECGKKVALRSSAITCGKTRSCGCLRSDTSRAILAARAEKHGLTPEERAIKRVWYGMRNRCYRKADKNYDRYGGRGIGVCDEWRDDWRAVLRDMGPRPSPAHSIDRIDNDKGYSPDNCRWATDFEQNSNRRNAYRVIVNGQSVPLAEIARQEGIPPPRAR